MITDEQALRMRREAIVAEHVAAENRNDVERAVATFHHPRYEVNGETTDGDTAVRDLLQGLMVALPDFYADVKRFRHTDDAVICEARITGTHLGVFAGIPATGRQVNYPCLCIFEFDDDRLVCEKVYYDFATVLRQLGVMHEPPAPGAS